MKTRRRKRTDAMKEEPFTVVEIEDFETVCHVCNAEFLDEEDLKLHVTQLHLNETNGKTICKLCRTVLPDAAVFVTHLVFKHLEDSLFCFHCYRLFSDPLQLDQHELKHCPVADNSTVSCSQCSTIFTNRQELQKHEYQDHTNSDDGFMLNKFFPLLSSALNIKIKKFIDCLCKKKVLVCRKCKYSSTCVKAFIEHLKTLKCQCFACEKCFNVYKKKNSIMNHMRQKTQCHNYVIETESQCCKCNNYFSPKDINEHEKCCEFVKCSACNKYFSSINELTDHRNEEHKVSISLEICKYCKKEFVGAVSLKKHMSRSHKNKKLYKYNCIHCGSLFTHPSKLFAHFFTQHKEIQPYTCKICNLYFRLRKHFTIHIKLHHKSVGFVEFDNDLHVFFTDKKSENPVRPQAYMDVGSTTDASDTDNNDVSEEDEHAKNEESRDKDDSERTDVPVIQSTASHDDKTVSNDHTVSKVCGGATKSIDSIEIEIERLDTPLSVRRKRRPRKLKSPEKDIDAENSPDQLSDNSEEEPLSNVKEALLRKKIQTSSNLKRRMAIRDKKAKLTCKICRKYCYTVQNYHHHLTLHEKTKMKRCIKCNEYFKSRQELKNHLDSFHSSSKLIETLKSVLEKRKRNQPVEKPAIKPGELLKSLLEKRRKQELITAQNTITNKFRRTIKKVDVVDDCTATITPMSDHGLSVKNFIENFKPDADSVNICNSVTLKAVRGNVEKTPLIKMYKFNPEPPPSETCLKLSFPVKFKNPPVSYMNNKVRVQLIQQLVTKPKLVNMTYNERIPVVQEKRVPDEYCNMFADETDYTQYKNDTIPEVAHEVMLGDPEDIPATRRLAQEIIIPKISEEHGGVRIGHLLPQAPYYKIVKVKKLLKSNSEAEAVPEPSDNDVTLPDGTRLISVKNPFSHLIPNEHLEKVLKANKTYYTPKAKNIEKAIARALKQVRTPPEKRVRRITKKDLEEV